MKQKPYDLLIVGNLAGIDVVLAEHLERRGLHCVVARNRTSYQAQREIVDDFTGYNRQFDLSHIHWVAGKLDFVRLARQSRMIVAFSGTILTYLKWLWPLRDLLGLPPIANWHTGADIMELARQKSLHGRFYRNLLKAAALNIGFSYPDALASYLQLKVPNLVFLHFPYLQPEYVDGKLRNSKSDVLRFFHASHFDFKINDPGDHRKTSKGNDRFLRAFARALRDGLKAECVLLDRGPDRDVARELVEQLGIAKYCTWKPHLSRPELIEEFAQADVVVDQFDIGGHGGIAIEAMSMGKPVLMWAAGEAYRVSYPEVPPVLNAFSEDEIYEQLMFCKDRTYLEKLGKQAHAWVQLYNNWQTCLDPFLFYFTLITGKAIVDYNGKA